MSRIVDKIIIFALTIFAMRYTLHGNSFLMCIYAAIIYSALNYYLLDRDRDDFSMKPVGLKEYIAFGLQLLAVISFFVYSPFIVLLPIIMYDIFRSRNYVALTIASFSCLAAMSSVATSLLLYVIILSVLSGILSIKSEKSQILKRNYKTLRDDEEEKSRKLRSQNTELLNAKDTEIHNAQLSERNRIAREIHDNVGHTLSRAILQVGALLAIHKEEPFHSELEGVRETLDNAMNNIRSSVHDLHDESIDVKAGIKQLAEPLKERFNLHMEVDIGDDMPRPVKYAIIGISKECISNIIKHSENTDVDIVLNEHPSMYQLIIHDYESQSADLASNSGTRKTGLKAKNENYEPGMGLENICGRVESVKGKMNISTENGFKVFVTIPR